MIQVLPPGPMTPVHCQDCNGTTFCLTLEGHDNRVPTIHTACVGCGKRGAFRDQTEIVTARQFVQFANSPKHQDGTA